MESDRKKMTNCWEICISCSYGTHGDINICFYRYPHMTRSQECLIWVCVSMCVFIALLLILEHNANIDSITTCVRWKYVKAPLLHFLQMLKTMCLCFVEDCFVGEFLLIWSLTWRNKKCRCIPAFSLLLLFPGCLWLCYIIWGWSSEHPQNTFTLSFCLPYKATRKQSLINFLCIADSAKLEQYTVSPRVLAL